MTLYNSMLSGQCESPICVHFGPHLLVFPHSHHTLLPCQGIKLSWLPQFHWIVESIVYRVAFQAPPPNRTGTRGTPRHFFRFTDTPIRIQNRYSIVGNEMVPPQLVPQGPAWAATHLLLRLGWLGRGGKGGLANKH